MARSRTRFFCCTAGRTTGFRQRTADKIEYPDAHHVFDAPLFKQEAKFAQINSLRNCHFAEAGGGNIVNAETKQPTGPNDPCFQKGVTAAYNDGATKKAREDVKSFLKSIFGS